MINKDIFAKVIYFTNENAHFYETSGGFTALKRISPNSPTFSVIAASIRRAFILSAPARNTAVVWKICG